MKFIRKKQIRILFFFLSGIIGWACSGTHEQGSVPEGRLISYSSCKSAAKSTGADIDQNDTISCIQYQYDETTKLLSLQHINAGFNCCPGELTCTVTLLGDTIMVVESESVKGCKCDCLYDLDIEISGIEPQSYFLKIEEPYCGSQQEIGFKLDLPEIRSGNYCVSRTSYPWGS